MTITVGRRQFIAALGGAAAWPVRPRAQQQAMPVIGLLGGVTAAAFAKRITALRRGLSEAGYVEGRNLTIEYRWADDKFERLPALAAELVTHRVAVIIAFPDRAVIAAKTATASIPIVFSSGGDPVRAGLVASLNRPGGNVTGVTRFNVDLVPKRLELLHELVPAAALVALMTDENNADAVAQRDKVLEAAGKLGVRLLEFAARTPDDIDKSFAALVQQRSDALVVGSGAFFTSRRAQIVAAAARHRIPAVYASDEFVADGGLISYGNSAPESFHRVGIYTGRILNGEKPADLPVERSTRFDLVINLKTAKALGLDFSREFLLRADEVIE